MEASEILVVILSFVLAIGLIIFVVTGLLVYKLVKDLRMIASRADHVASNIADASDFMKKSAGPMAAAKILGSFLNTVVNSKTKKGK
jgi:hypothetical protein